LDLTVALLVNIPSHFCPVDGVCVFLRHVGIRAQTCMMWQPRKPPSCLLLYFSMLNIIHILVVVWEIKREDLQTDGQLRLIYCACILCSWSKQRTKRSKSSM
jgi:hypothetical protein